MQRFVGIIVICSTAAICLAEIKSIEDFPQHWRVILGDICQLPSYPRATGDPHRYVECVRQNSFTGSRKDLGIWLLRECLPGYEFVASARLCITSQSVKAQEELCNSSNSSMYEFCPSQAKTEFLVEEIREAPRQCECPNGENNCVCPSPEILELVKMPFSHYPPCPCSAVEPTCVCVTTNNQDEQHNCQITTTQQQYCPQPSQLSAIVQPQACPLVKQGVQGAQYQGICSWMVDTLAVDAQSRTHYLQCQPAPNSLLCGRWQRMPCAPSTVFDVQAQVCVWDTQTTSSMIVPFTQPQFPTYAIPNAQQRQQCSCIGGVQIGSCNQNYQCPGQSVCQVGQNYGKQCMVCCYFRRKS